MRRARDEKNLTADFAEQSARLEKRTSGPAVEERSLVAVEPLGERSDEEEQPNTVPASGPRHVAIIMDGNGRWATRRGLPRSAGHRAGARAVRKTVEAAPEMDIDVLTLYAFSSDNWKRPPHEVEALMDLFERYLEKEAEGCVENSVRVAVIGRRDRLRPRLVRSIESIEQASRGGERLLLRLAVDYSARWAIAEAARRMTAGSAATGFDSRLLEAIHSPEDVGPVDLLIRTGGERRLSDFLLWESAYAELCFIDCFWPDFGRDELADALADFDRRERRFGGVPVPVRPALATTGRP